MILPVKEECGKQPNSNHKLLCVRVFRERNSFSFHTPLLAPLCGTWPHLLPALKMFIAATLHSGDARGNGQMWRNYLKVLFDPSLNHNCLAEKRQQFILAEEDKLRRLSWTNVGPLLEKQICYCGQDVDLAIKIRIALRHSWLTKAKQ